MSTDISSSAKIYSFPRRGRFATGQADTPARLPTDQSTTRIVSGSSWYHDEAIQQARQDEDCRKN